MASSASSALLRASVKDRTSDAYLKEIRKFADWLRATSHPPITSYIILDNLLLSYIDERFDSTPTRGERQYCINLLSGIQHFMPYCRHHIHLSWKAIRGWNNLVPGRTTTPFPYGLHLLFAFLFLRDGRIQLGILLVVAFDNYLRAREALALRVVDIQPPTPGQSGSIAVLAAKTGAYQSVRLRSGVATDLLLWWKDVRAQRGYSQLFDVSYHQWLAAIQQLAGQLCVTKLRFTIHSLRHGGATHDFIQGMSLPDILHRGRWASTKTTERYIQDGPAHALEVQLPAAVHRMSSLLESRPGILRGRF